MQRARQIFGRLGRLLPVLVLVAALPGGCSGGGDLSSPTEYQAVFLDNGQVFFGKLADAGSPFLTLREVYYVQTVVEKGEKDQKKTANVLIKRGSEWHNPDFMRINREHVVVIEPVAPDSRVAQLIREARQHPAGAAPPAKEAPPPPAAPPPGAEKPKKGPRP